MTNGKVKKEVELEVNLAKIQLKKEVPCPNRNPHPNWSKLACVSNQVEALTLIPTPAEGSFGKNGPRISRTRPRNRRGHEGA